MDSYKEQIVSYFTAKLKEEGRSVSSEERALLSLWEEAGVPLKVIIEGIDVAFRDRGERIHSLCDCQGAVLELWLDYKSSTQAGVVVSPRRTKLTNEELDELFSRVASSFNAARFAAEKEKNVRLIDILDSFFKRLLGIREIFGQGKFTVEDLRLQLFALDWELSAVLPHALDEGELSRLRDEAAKGGVPLDDEVSFSRYVAEHLRKRLHLPPLVEFLPR